MFNLRIYNDPDEGAVTVRVVGSGTLVTKAEQMIIQ